MSNAVAAKLFKCLSEEVRVRLVRLLAEEELSVNELVAILDLPQSTLSRHLAVLKEAELLAARRQGPSTFYRLTRDGAANGATGDLLQLVRGLSKDDPSAALDRDNLEKVRTERRRAQRDFFDQNGASWDAFHARIADPSAKTSTVNRLVPEGMIVVDAGCGSGYLLPELAAIGARVIAVDHSKNQLAKARERAAALGMTMIDFREGDLTALPIDDRSVDAVFCYLSLHHVPHPESAIRDFFRVLRPGGRLVLTDFKSHEESWLASEHADLWLGFDPGQVENWMRTAGFADTRSEERAYARDDAGRSGDAASSGAPKKTPGRGAAGLRLFVVSGTVPQVPAKEMNR